MPVQSAYSSPVQVTISLLPTTLSLVHIPRSRVTQLSHPVLKQILEPNPTFLNVTCNEIELSLFADHQVLADFEPIARHDRQKHRSRSGSTSSRRQSNDNDEMVEVSYEKWSVLQIDSHSDRYDKSGARVTELSAKLAAAGISILYQSSYMCDFIFVKENRLHEAMVLLEASGFDLYSADSVLVTSRAVSRAHSPTHDELLEHPESPDRDTVDGDPSFSPENGSQEPYQAHVALKPGSRKNKSCSPTPRDVHTLSPNLSCVGLCDENVDQWGLKIVKLIAFPELIPSASAPIKHHHSHIRPEIPPLLDYRNVQSPSSSSGSSSDEDGYFSHSPHGSFSTCSLSSPSRSFSDLPTKLSLPSPPSKHSYPPLSPLKLASDGPERARSEIQSPQTQSPRVPFFSFTRTSEGSSLTTDASLLAILFPPEERHMVICGGDLDAADPASSDSAMEDDEEGSEKSQGNTLKCLQIDLRRFGLDKHGLVNKFSRVLEENGINHMYSSTFKTANLLVDKRHAVRAQSLLRSC